MLGKLKRSLKERCPQCGKILELRVIEAEKMNKGIVGTTTREYICCSNKNCDYERKAEQKRKRKENEISLV